MSGRGRRVDVRIAHTVAYLLRCSRSSVPEAMRACKFSLNESESRSRQMTIRRSFAKKPPPDIIDTATAATTTVSPLTNQMSMVRGGPSTPTTTPPRTPMTPTTPGGTRPTRPKPKQRLIRTIFFKLKHFWQGRRMDRRENEIEEVSAAEVWAS